MFHKANVVHATATHSDFKDFTKLAGSAILYCESVFAIEVYMKKVTIKDIAKRSGYSVATVSKALNNTDRVGATTISKIKLIATEMGYQSSLFAQSLAGKNRTVAIMMPENPPEVCTQFQTGFATAFRLYEELGIQPAYYLYDTEKAGMAKLPWNIIEASADAVIAIPGVHFEAYRSHFEALEKKMPLVFLQSKPAACEPPARLCDVTIQARVVGAMAAQYISVCEPGGQTAVITGHQESWIHHENLIGYQSAAKKYGLRYMGAVDCLDKMDRAYQAASNLLAQFPALSGIFVSSYTAPAVCRCIQDKQRNVTVVGVDLFPETVACLQEGTLAASIFQDQAKQAHMAVDAVVSAFRSETVSSDLLVKPELVLNANLCCYLT